MRTDSFEEAWEDRSVRAAQLANPHRRSSHGGRESTQRHKRKIGRPSRSTQCRRSEPDWISPRQRRIIVHYIVLFLNWRKIWSFGRTSDFTWRQRKAATRLSRRPADSASA